MGGAEALWRSQMAYGMGSHQMAGSGGQVNAEVGYGLPAGRFWARRASASGRLSTGATTGWGCWSREDSTSASTCRGTRRESIMIPEPDHQVVTRGDGDLVASVGGGTAAARGRGGSSVPTGQGIGHREADRGRTGGGDPTDPRWWSINERRCTG